MPKAKKVVSEFAKDDSDDDVKDEVEDAAKGEESDGNDEKKKPKPTKSSKVKGETEQEKKERQKKKLERRAKRAADEAKEKKEEEEEENKEEKEVEDVKKTTKKSGKKEVKESKTEKKLERTLEEGKKFAEKKPTSVQSKILETFFLNKEEMTLDLVKDIEWGIAFWMDTRLIDDLIPESWKAPSTKDRKKDSELFPIKQPIILSYSLHRGYAKVWVSSGHEEVMALKRKEMKYVPCQFQPDQDPANKIKTTKRNIVPEVTILVAANGQPIYPLPALPKSKDPKVPTPKYISPYNHPSIFTLPHYQVSRSQPMVQSATR